eukprot:6606_1
MKSKILLWCIILIQFAISASNSDSLERDSLERDSPDRDLSVNDIIVGSYNLTAEGMNNLLNVCNKNGRYYFTMQRVEPGYVHGMGRSTDVIESDDILTVQFFDAYQFNDAKGIGVEPINSFSIIYNADKNTYKLSNGVILTKIDNKADINLCVAPEKSWNDVSLPVLVEDIVNGFTEIRRYDSGDACWAAAEIENEETIPNFYQGGSAFINVQYFWDGAWRVTDWDEFGTNLGGCSSGSQYDVWIGDDLIWSAVKCEGVNEGWDFTLTTDCKLCNAFNKIECPLYKESVSAHSIASVRTIPSGRIRMSASNILEHANNDNYNHKNDAIININFSHTTIANLWAILIVFVLATAVVYVFCLYQNRKNNKEQHFDLPSSV